MKKRIISAVIMVLIFIPFLLLGGIYFSVFMGVIGLMGLHELVHIRESQREFPFITKLFAYLLFIALMFACYGNIDLNFSLDFSFISIMIFLFVSPIVIFNNSEKYNITDALYLIGCLLFLGLSFNLMSVIRNKDITYFIYLLLIQTLTDSFALISGMLIGKHKLCSISPKKTIEGTIGGSLVGTFVGSAFYITVINPSASLVFIIFLTLGLSLVGQLGDLVFSAIKRYYDKKDFSNLIPGHGGILDRFDSLIFITLAFVLVIKYL